MISANGWLDWALRNAGPAHKVYPTVNGSHGIVWHSMEGTYNGSMSVLMGPRQSSWMFSLRYDGTLVQHYPITASCWASGNGLANTSWWSVELEGFHSNRINALQQATAERLMVEWADYKQMEPTREGNLWTKTMWEHREVDTLVTPNAGDTACPSERYAPLWATLTEDEVNQAQFDAMADDYFARRLPTWLPLAFEDVPGRFSDRPDVPIAFPYAPWQSVLTPGLRIGDTVTLAQPSKEETD